MPSSSIPSSGSASGNSSTPPNTSPTLPSSTHVALPSYQSAPSTSISASNAGARRLREPLHRYAARPIRCLEVVGVADHRRVEAGAGHDGEALVVEPADVEPPAVAVQADGDGALDVLRDAEVRREQVRGPGGDDGERRVGPGEHVDAAPHGPVAAPGEDEVGALVERAPHLLGRLLGLRHLVPERVLDTGRGERAAQLGQPAADGLARVGDDGDGHATDCARWARAARARLPGARRRGHARRPAARTAARAARRSRSTTPAGDVERMVHAAVHARQRRRRPAAGSPASRPAPARPRLRKREVNSRTRPA